MPIRITPLVNGEYYHVYNRGVARQLTYFSKKDYERFLFCLSYYRFNGLPFKLSRLLQIPKEDREQMLAELTTKNDKAVEVISFCLMPNHFHLLLQQISSGGISKFMKQVTDSYTRYINTKNDRVGPLYQGSFKTVYIGNNEQLIHLSRYIHLNPLVGFILQEKDFINYQWSSLKDYLGETQRFVNPKIILENFKSKDDYLKFVMDQADYAIELDKIKHVTIEKE